MPTVSFYWRDVFPEYRTDDARYEPLGVWFVMELRNSPYQCLDLLAIVDDVVSGRSETARWEGEAFDVLVADPMVEVVNTILPNQRGSYPLNDVRRLAEQYWQFLSELPEVAFDITAWEATWKRAHPYRGRLF